MSNSLPNEVAQALDQGATIVTANQRSARILQLGYQQQQLELGRSVWQPAQIFSWDTWTTSLWQQLLLDGQENRVLLSAEQEQLVWRAVISADQQLATMQNHRSLAALAQQAWALLASYRGLSKLHQPVPGVDAQAFRRWAIEFDRRCQREQWVSQAQLEELLAEAIAAEKLPIQKTELALIGFDRMTPAQQALCEAIRQAGIPCDALALSPPTIPLGTTSVIPSLTLVEARNSQEELVAAASWAQKTLAEHPDARIAIIFPNVTSHRHAIDRIFRPILAPELLDITMGDAALPYEFTLGTALSHTPLVRTAMTLLHWLVRPLPLEQVSGLLLSAYVGNAASELPARARFDAYSLRKAKILKPEISLNWLLSQMKKDPALAALSQQLANALRAATEFSINNRQTSYGNWADFFQQTLQTAGWPGTRTMSSTEFQQMRKWQDPLDQLAQLDFTNEHVNFASALEALEQIAAQALFAPESHNAPIQIMGVLESSGSVFDAVWFAGATAQAWPAQGSPQPLLPWQLQHSLNMPHSDPSIDYEHAAVVTQRIASSAPQVIFSYARMEDELETEQSPLLRDVVCPEVYRAAALALQAGEDSSSADLEAYDATGQISPLPDRVIAGGAAILKLQSLCPFRAFAEKRLASTEPESREIGFNAMERGNLIHEVMERFWKQVKTQEALRQLSEAERDACLRTHIRAVLSKEIRATDTWEQAYIDLQQQWLSRLLSQWLQQELQRPPFAVLASEATHRDETVGPLHLQLRPDRIDKVDDGEVILDYKTSLCSRKSWDGPRPEEPQLPLYGTRIQPDALRGIAFAQIRAGEIKLLGYASRENILHQSPPKDEIQNLAQKRDEWKAVLEGLASDFHQGIADVSPKQFPKTCEYCNQKSFCRVTELNPILVEDGTDDDMESTLGADQE
ncbi:MAG: PD-(D/E)XK nuclease family protein [Acidobacteriaceae bacterium]